MKTLKLTILGILCFFLYYSLICLGFAMVFNYNFFVVTRFPFMIFTGGLVTITLTVSTIMDIVKNKERLPKFQEEPEDTPYWLRKGVEAKDEE